MFVASSMSGDSGALLRECPAPALLLRHYGCDLRLNEGLLHWSDVEYWGFPNFPGGSLVGVIESAGFLVYGW